MKTGELKKMGGQALTEAIGKMNAETSARLEHLVETVTLASVTHAQLAEQLRVVYCEDPQLSMSVGGDQYKAIQIKPDKEETANGDYIDQLIACMTTFFVVKGPCPDRKKINRVTNIRRCKRFGMRPLPRKMNVAGCIGK